MGPNGWVLNKKLINSRPMLDDMVIKLNFIQLSLILSDFGIQCSGVIFKQIKITF